MRKSKTVSAILDLKMAKNDSGAKTIREYLKKLLEKLWAEGEGFSGKRPFGNSDWYYDLYAALIAAGAIKGELDDDGDILAISRDERDKGDQIIFDAIAAL